jgi:hypothetical protein
MSIDPYLLLYISEYHLGLTPTFSGTQLACKALHKSCYLSKMKGKKAYFLSIFMAAPNVLCTSQKIMK